MLIQSLEKHLLKLFEMKLMHMNINLRKNGGHGIWQISTKTFSVKYVENLHEIGL